MAHLSQGWGPRPPCESVMGGTSRPTSPGAEGSDDPIRVSRGHLQARLSQGWGPRPPRESVMRVPPGLPLPGQRWSDPGRLECVLAEPRGEQVPALPPGRWNPMCLAVQGAGSPIAAIVSVQLLGKDSCSTDLMRLLVRTLCAPSSVGFNVGDVRVMEQLPDVCVALLRALKTSPHRDMLEARLREEVTAERWGSGRALCGGSVSQGMPSPRIAAMAWALQASKCILAGLVIVRVLIVRRPALTWFFFVFLA